MWPFKKKFKKLVDNKYRIEEAFKMGGTVYYHFANQEEVPAGRQMMALAYYEEMNMRVDREYLDLHVRAMEKLLSDPKKISVMYIAQLNLNLKERLELMPLPEFIYKLASVVFFDESESPYSYDYDYNKKKIQRWKQSGDVLDFFLQTPLKDLIPALSGIEKNSKMYFPVAEKIAEIHRENLSKILSATQ